MLHLAQDQAADQLLSDNALALLIGLVLDQQIPLERAFAAPLELSRRLGEPLEAARLAGLAPGRLEGAFSQRPALHRFPLAMAKRVSELARLVVESYGGEPATIWTTAGSGAELLARVRLLPGFGEQKARIFLALLGKQLGVRPPGWREAAGKFGNDGTRISIADIDGPDSLAEVRAYKADLKAAAKSFAALSRQAAPRSGLGKSAGETRAGLPGRASGAPKRPTGRPARTVN